MMRKIYIRKHTSVNLEDPHGYFYLLYKVHRAHSPGKHFPTRPACLDCASVTDPVGKFVDINLQPIAKSMQT